MCTAYSAEPADAVTCGRRRSTTAPAARARRLLPLVGAILAGGLVAGSFAPVDVWPLAPLGGVAALTLVLRGRSARSGLGYGALAGLGTFVPVLVLAARGGPRRLARALAVTEAVVFAPLGLAVALVTRLPGWPVWASALWVAEEAGRDRVPFGGFPWARLAFGQAGSPLVKYAAIGGAPLVTFAVALAGCLLAAAVLAAFPLLRWTGRSATARTVGSDERLAGCGGSRRVGRAGGAGADDRAVVGCRTSRRDGRARSGQRAPSRPALPRST